MGWRVICLLPLFCFTFSFDAIAASSFPTLSDTRNYLPQSCQISRLHKSNAKRKINVDVKQPEATILKSSSSSRVKKDLMKLNLFDLPRALVWLLNRLNGRRELLSSKMIPSSGETLL